jgi:hypothetical protein
MRELPIDARNSPNEAKVNLYRMCRLTIDARDLPNEAKVNLYRMCGLTIRTRNLPNEAKVNLYGLYELTIGTRNLPNEANSAEVCGNTMSEPISHGALPGWRQAKRIDLRRCSKGIATRFCETKPTAIPKRSQLQIPKRSQLQKVPLES